MSISTFVIFVIKLLIIELTHLVLYLILVHTSMTLFVNLMLLFLIACRITQIYLFSKCYAITTSTTTAIISADIFLFFYCWGRVTSIQVVKVYFIAIDFPIMVTID